MTIVSLSPGSRAVPSQLTISDQPAYKGGEGSVFITSDGNHVVKIYHRPSSDKQKLLRQVLDLGKNLGEDEQFLAWPLGIVERLDDQPAVGVVTRRVSSQYAALYRFMYSPVDAVEQFRRGRSWLEYLKMARGTAAAVRTINGKGMAHSDISPSNFLANPVSGEVVLIDLDGLVVKGFLPPQVSGTPGCIAPEVMMGKAKPDELTDRHSLAVLVLWTLLFRNVMQTQTCYDPSDERHDDVLGFGQHACFSEHPSDRRNWIARIGTPLFRGGALSYHALPPRLQELAGKALIDGLHDPLKRPQVVEWERALAEAYDGLVSCQSCRQSYFYPYWLQPPPRRQCPFCGTGIRPPLPAVLELMEARAKGTHVPVRTVVLYHGLPLFSDVGEPGRLPPFTRRSTPIIGQTLWDQQENVHRLVNAGEAPWQIVAGGSTIVPPGGSVKLRKGVILSLGNGKRLLRVIE